MTRIFRGILVSALGFALVAVMGCKESGSGADSSTPPFDVKKKMQEQEEHMSQEMKEKMKEKGQPGKESKEKEKETKKPGK